MTKNLKKKKSASNHMVERKVLNIGFFLSLTTCANLSSPGSVVGTASISSSPKLKWVALVYSKDNNIQKIKLKKAIALTVLDTI